MNRFRREFNGLKGLVQENKEETKKLRRELEEVKQKLSGITVGRIRVGQSTLDE